MATVTEIDSRTSSSIKRTRAQTKMATQTETQQVTAKPTAKPYTGKDHKWARSPSSRANGTVASLAPTIMFQIVAIWFHKSSLGIQFYTWLNANYTQWQINLWWRYALTTGLYLVIGAIFMAFDMNDTLHNMVKKYKVQPDKRITWAEYRDVWAIALRNAILVNFPFNFVVSYMWPSPTGLPLPGARRTLAVYTVSLFCEEAGFYLVHRAVHSKMLYAKIHKMHHRFTAPVALASTYCTLTEHVFSNIAPIVVGLVLCDAHWSLTIQFFASLLVGTLCTHSDYNIPYLFNALQHDWHHYAYTENYGPIGLLDEILGTNKGFKVWLGELQRRDALGWYRTGREELIGKSA